MVADPFYHCALSGKKTDQQKLEKKIAKAIEEKFAFDVPVIVKEFGKLKQIIADNRFLVDKAKNNVHLHVTFLADKPEQENFIKIKGVQYRADELHLIDKAIICIVPTVTAIQNSQIVF